MVFKPIYPNMCLTQLISGSVMIIAAAAVIWKVRNGSRNLFAYVLMFFTTLLGIAYIGLSASKAFRREVVLPDGTTKFFINYYVNNIFDYARFITAT